MDRHTFRVVPTWLLLVSLVSSPLTADVIISEFLASNQSDLVDEDGDTPDWVELYNDSDETVDLDGWFLTDDPTEGTKWQFPTVSMPPRSYLVVRCSGKERSDPAGSLHTSFNLSRHGEYLGLIEPGGGRIHWQFTPRFDPQVRDVSFGFAQELDESKLVDSGAQARYLVPPDGSLELSWTEPGFDDSAWSAGPMGVGFDQASRPKYADLIETDIGDAMRRINASAYLRIRFQVEDANAFDLMELLMKYEDGFVAYLNGVEVARSNAPDEPLWDSKSTGRQSTSQARTFESFDLSSRKDLFVAGENVLAIHGMNDSATSVDFFILPELVGVKVGELELDRPQFFDVTSPGWPNGVGFDGAAEEPLFSAPSGSYTEPLTLELSNPAASGELRLTLDRSEPTVDSPLYEAPITINRSTVVKAKIFQPGLLPSPTATGTYLFLHSSVADTASKLPLVVINTFGVTIPGSGATTYGAMHMSIFDVQEDTGLASLRNPPEFEGNGGMRVRGASSAGFPKKNYSIETWDIDNDDLKVSLLGLPPESDWVLHGPYTDKTLMRNVLSYEWSNAIGQYAARTQFVELYLNTSASSVLTSSHYWGVYVLIEKIKLGSQRVNVRELSRGDDAPPAITGGYIFKKDRIDPGDRGFSTPRISSLAFYDPKEIDITPAQRSYLLGYLNDFERTLYGADFDHPDLGFRRYIDTASWIDHHIIVELAKNIDGFRLSTFYHKDFDGKIKMGPVWDYNLSLGNADYLQGWQPVGWYYPLISQDQYPWFTRIFADPTFRDAYNQRWSELRGGPLSTENLLASIERRVDEIEEAAERNFKRWPRLGIYDWPNAPGVQQRRTYESVIAFMRNWLTSRVNWMDSELTSPPRLSHPGGKVDAGLQVAITAPGGVIYYTLDGEDPRGAGNAPSESALEYDGTPITITKNMQIKARVLVDGSIWSDLTEAAYYSSIPTLVITEIMYNPIGGTDYEFIEVYNFGDQPVELRGIAFTRGVTLTFDESHGSLEPGAHLVIAANLETFAQRYDTSTIIVAGEYTGNLRDTGESITIVGAATEPILDNRRYDDSWYPETDGNGHSLVLLDPTVDTETWAEPESWRPSTVLHGSPGVEDPDEAPRPAQIPGDMSQDGVLGMADAIQLLQFLFTEVIDRLPCGAGSPAEASNLLLLDSNSDFKVDEADAVFVLSHLFLGGEAPRLGTECMEIDGCPEVCSIND